MLIHGLYSYGRLDLVTQPETGVCSYGLYSYDIGLVIQPAMGYSYGLYSYDRLSLVTLPDTGHSYGLCSYDIYSCGHLDLVTHALGIWHASLESSRGASYCQYRHTHLQPSAAKPSATLNRRGCRHRGEGQASASRTP